MFETSRSQPFSIPEAPELTRSRRPSCPSISNFNLGSPPDCGSDDQTWIHPTPPHPSNCEEPDKPRKQLHVVLNGTRNGTITYLAPRPHHCSTLGNNCEGLAMQTQDKAQLRAILLARLKPPTREDGSEVKDYLRVAVGNMLERIIYWDRDGATTMENEHDYGCKILSTIPTIADIDESHAEYLVDRFRKAVSRLDLSDWRRGWAELDEETLRGLVRFTLLHARPVLAWEMDLGAF